MIHVAKTIIEDNAKFLLIKRAKDSKFFPGQWDFPGGKIKADEKPSESAARETKEETALDIIIGDMIIEGSHTEKETEIHYQVFLTKECAGEIKLSQDHSEFKWVSKEQIKGLETTPFVKAFLAFSKAK